MPPKTVLLAQMMRELSAKPGFVEGFIAQLAGGGKQGAAYPTPALLNRLRELILGKDWEGLDRFPGWTMREINPTIRLVGELAGGGAIAGTETSARLREFIDLGEYSLDLSERISLDLPSQLPVFGSEGIVTALGDGVVRGDGASPALAPLHPESQRLADAMNRLALNSLEQSATAVVTISGIAANTPERLIVALIESGHSVVVTDARYFANFGHFHYEGAEVMMPFWVNSEILVPGTNRPLLVPASHAEYEWEIRGPKINANISWYYAVDGKAQFRTMDTLDQAWVLGRYAHTYRDADAIEVTRLVALFTVAYAHQHMARPVLPFGGYYALGVCQDSVAAIETKMTGKATLFPNTADVNLFDNPRDEEVNRLIEAIPKDRDGRSPEPERIFGSLPVEDLSAITIPGLAADLTAVRDAWNAGTLERTTGLRHRLLLSLLWCVGAIVSVARVFTRRKRGAKI